ncbi:MAG: DnaD domain protein [Chloroflexi bacterium]|nr:DnaD domain protein [Chloroflexota bacterium]
MKQFSGFPARMQFTPIPNLFFSSVLPDIDDIAELKVTLHIFWSLYPKRGSPRFTTYRELLGDKSLMSSLRGSAKPPEEILRDALAMAVKRGTIIHLALSRDGTAEDVYFLNTESDRRAVDKIRNGELALAGLKAGGQAYPEVDTEPLPDIFTLYEENIGMLTPMIAEELREAEKVYPEGWIGDAIKEAVNQGKRKWSYISAVLESWSTEGKTDGTYQRDFKKADPDKYIKGKYGHIVRR